MGLEPTAIRHRLRRKSTALNHCAMEVSFVNQSSRDIVLRRMCFDVVVGVADKRNGKGESVSERTCFLHVCCCRRRVCGFVQEVGYPLRLSFACVVKIVEKRNTLAPAFYLSTTSRTRPIPHMHLTPSFNTFSHTYILSTSTYTYK